MIFSYYISNSIEKPNRSIYGEIHLCIFELKEWNCGTLIKKKYTTRASVCL